MPGSVPAITLPPGVPPPATADQRRLLEQARGFEALLLSFLTRQLTESAGLGERSGAAAMHGQLVSDSLSEGIAAGGGIGIAGMVYGQLVERSST